MADFDVFNGDADGICSLLQLRLNDPRPDVQLVTGRKRDIALLARVEAGAGDRVTVLDVSMRNNAADLQRLLDNGASVFYADHHNAGETPLSHSNLEAHINLAPEMCTAVIINSLLRGAFLGWAAVGAYGDNFPALAGRISSGQNYDLSALERLGILLNYNGYGASLEDLHIHPAALYRACLPYKTPEEFLSAKTDVYAMLDAGYESDFTVAKSAKPLLETAAVKALLLPDAASSRRVSGVYGNQLAQAFPDRAHAVLTRNGASYTVSVRAPLSRRKGADRLCLQFETGGGRAAAAGINRLEDHDLDRFLEAFQLHFE
jgi:hypothetical protein